MVIPLIRSTLGSAEGVLLLLVVVVVVVVLVVVVVVVVVVGLHLGVSLCLGLVWVCVWA